jgi:hypothetical protein
MAVAIFTHIHQPENGLAAICNPNPDKPENILLDKPFANMM